MRLRLASTTPIWRKPPRQLLRRFDVHDEWFGIGGQRVIFGRKIEAAPVDAGFRRNRRFEIIAERRAERRFVSGRHADMIDDRRISTVVGAREQLGDRLAFG